MSSKRLVIRPAKSSRICRRGRGSTFPKSRNRPSLWLLRMPIVRDVRIWLEPVVTPCITVGRITIYLCSVGDAMAKLTQRRLPIPRGTRSPLPCGREWGRFCT